MAKKNKNSNDKNSSVIKEIIQSDIFSINLQGLNREDYDEIAIDIAIWVDKWSMNILNKIFRIIQTELGYIISFMGNQDIFSCLSNLLFQNFHSEYMNKKNLEKSIEMKINDLEKYKFLAPKDISDETGFMEDNYEEISFEKVLDLIKSLRKKKIDIFKTLLEDFKNNKEKYLKFMKKQDYTYF